MCHMCRLYLHVSLCVERSVMHDEKERGGQSMWMCEQSALAYDLEISSKSNNLLF